MGTLETATTNTAEAAPVIDKDAADGASAKPALFLKSGRRTQRSYRQKRADDDDDDNDKPEENKEGLSVQDAIELRRLRKRNAGVSVSQLEKGVSAKQQGRQEEDDSGTNNSDDPWKLKSGGGLVHIKDIRGRTFGVDSTSGSASGKAAASTTNAFETASTAMDTTKHMKAFIEAELKKRHGQEFMTSADAPLPVIVAGGGAVLPHGTAPDATENSASSAHESTVDFEQQLYEIPESLQVKKRIVVEDNMTLSASMLTAIPEVDLGITNRIRNIEMTEQAKRDMLEKKKSTTGAKSAAAGDDAVANVLKNTAAMPAERFWGTRASGHHQQHRNSKSGSDASSMNNGLHGKRQSDGQHGDHKNHKRHMATDLLVLEKFKKRMRR